MVNIFSPIAKKVRRCISEYKKGQAQESVGFFELYRFATCPEWFAILLASVACCVMGLAIPLSCISYGEFTALLIDRTMTAPCTSSPTFIMEMFGGGKILVDPTPEQQREALLEDSKAFAISNVVLWLIQLLLGIAGVDLLNYVAIRQINRIRRLLLQSVLRQDITWYDTNTDSTFSSKLTDDIEKIKEGIGEKVGIFMYLLSSFVTAVLIALLYGWKLTLVIMSSTPLVILSTAFVAQIQSRLTAKELEAYGSAGRVAEEVLGSIKTVVAFAGQKKEEERYAEHLKPVRDLGNRKGYYSGLGTGLLWFILYSSYSVSFYYGVSLILEDRTKEYKEYTPAVLFIVFFGILGGAENLGLTAPLLETFNIARGAAVGVFALIDRKSDIDSTGKDGKMLDNPDGDIVFENVYFSYPARPDITILENFNLTICAGETLALVGLTGSGKSTCVQLVQRLYDPQKGKITVAGHDLRDLNVKSLRSAIGVVGQEPVLFGTTIADNIRYGRPSCTQEDIEEAARNANCHDFIMKLKDGYETKVGERGGRLSGGQRQRIAIARALIRHPTILLLDEATSALDTRSQAKVQKALDKAAVGRTTIIVSHRLSTIVNADRIVYMDHGQIREMGSHKELMEKKGLYFNLVQTDDLRPSAEARRISESSQSRKHSKHIESSDDESSSSESGDTRVTSALSIDTSIPDKSLVDKIKMDSTFLRLLKLNSPEWLLLVLGCTASVAVGATLPMFAIVFGDIYGIFLLDDEKEIMDNTKVYCIYFMLIGIITGFGSFVQLSVFNIAGSRLIARLRKAAFSAMMRQEMAWFDDDKNSVGALSSRLAGECSSIQGAVGGRIGSMLQAYATLVIGLFIAFYFSWKLSLISGVIIPLVIIAIFLEEKYLSHENVEGKAAIETSASIATEAIRNIRTVASLCQEMPFEERYMKEMDRVNKQAHAKTRLRGLIFSFGQGAPLLSYGLCLSYGGVMIANNELDYVAVIKVSEALMFGGWMLGQAMAYTPNINEAKDSARRIFKLFDREPKISSSSECKPLKKWKADGDIQYDEVKFSYPSQPDLPVLRGLNLEVKRGTTVALVGPSGCGKSTTIQLLQRLYDSFEGKITLDKLDIAEEIPLEVLRGQLGLVSQEPVLFDLTIAENIQYGDNTREVLMEEVIEAAKNANIHNFIKELPLGYETRIGNGGTQLSGGQKQRIAIARALVRNPRVLLLDEATSALDTLSEKLVQEALDNAGKGRTCITIAHRLTTVRGADMIHVFDQGEVVESGTHNQLMRREGAYWQLYRTEQGL